MNRRAALVLVIALALSVALVLGVRDCRHQPARRHGGSHGHQRRAAPALATPPAADRRETMAQVVEAITAQSDPAKLATLGSRQANPRLKRIVFYLAEGRDAGADPLALIRAAQRANGTAGTPRAPLVEAGLLRNLKIADGLGLLTPDNRERLKRGNAPVVTRGPYTGQPAEVDHIVPLALAPELDHELANLELLPETLNRRKSDKVGERQLDYARRFQAAGLLSAASFARVQGAFRPAGTADLELAVP